MSFESEFKLESENAIKACQEVTKVLAFTVFNNALNISPVGNIDLWDTEYPPKNYVGGRFRSNWFLSTDSPSDSVTDSRRGLAARKGELNEILTGPYSEEYILANNLPYAEAIEAAHSTQAPNGVVAPSIAFGNSKIKQIERAANKKYGVE